MSMRTKGQRAFCVALSIVAAGGMAGYGAGVGGVAFAGTIQPDEALPSPESLFQKHIEAIGGDAAIRAHTTRRIVGVVEFPQADAQVFLEMFQEAPDKLYMRVDNGLGDATETVYDGEVAWMKKGSEPAVKFPVDKAAPIIDTAAFYGEADYASRYTSMKTMPKERFGEVMSWPVEVTSKTGRKARVLFDPDSGRILGTDGEAAPGVMQRVFFRDYKEVEGVMAPQTLVQVTGENQAVLRYRTFEVNIKPEREYFDRPSELGGSSGG